MESLSRAFHRKNLRSFSAYDDVFSGGDRGRRGGAPATQIEDYMEIFRGSSSSIPVLDLSALDGAADVVEARGSSKKLDYSKIFGGFRGDDVADSYEAVFAKRTPTKTSHSDRSTRPGHQKDGDYQCGKSNKSLEGVKQYNTFYNRTSQISKDGENGTTHVAQIRAVPGFTCFIDENVQKTEGDKLESLPKDKIQTSSSELNKKQTTDGTKFLRSHSSWDKLNSVDRNADTNGSSVKTASFKLLSPTRVPASSASETKRLGELNSNVPKSGVLKSDPGDCSPSFSDEEQNVDSAAAVSAAALRKAVREAEASIRLAKEIMERTKNGLQKFPKPRSKEGLDMKKKKGVKTSIQAIRTETVSLNLKEIEQIGMENEGVRETDGAKSNSSDDGQVHITKLERKKARRSGKVVSSFMQSEENCVIENVSGKGNEEKMEMSDSKAPAQFPELLISDNQKKEKLYLEHTNGSNIRLFDGNVSGKVKEDKWENSAHARVPEQFPELVEAQNQRLPNFGLGHADDNNIAPYVSSGSEKANEEKSQPSADSKSLGKLPELVKVENQRAANFDVGQANGEDIMPSVHRVCVEVNEAQLELSASFNVVPQFPESVKSENSRTANLKSEHANGNNIMPSFLNLFGKIKEKLELSFDSITLGQFPEFMKTDNQKTVALELEHTSSNIRPSVHNFSEEANEKLERSADSEALGQFSEEVNEKLETSADSEALGQFPELVKTDNGSDIRPSVPNLSEDVNVKLETSADSEALGQFPELVKTDNQRTETLELDNTNGSNIRPPVPNLSEEVNEKLETSADSEEPGQFPQLVKTDNQRTATLELDYTNGSNIRQSVHNLSEKVDHDKLVISADSEAPGQFSELVKTDDQSTAILELEHINGSNITVSTDNPIQISNEEKLESYIDMKAQEKIPELVKIDNQRTASLELEPPNGTNNGPSVHLYSEKVNKMEASTNSVLDLECTNSSNFSPSVHNVPREANENKVEPSADSKAVGEFPDLGETCNCGSASSELGQKTGINMKLPVHTNECGEMENQTNGGTLELLERHSKEIHRKRKQWKDFEGKPSEIKIAEEEGQSVHDTTPKEVHEREERRSQSFEAHNKEIYRKRRQWKDVEIKPSDIRIADGGEKYVHGQEKGEKITDVLDNKDVEGKQEASSSEESYVKEIKSQDQEKNVSFESLSVQSNHSEKVDEARKSIQECSKETESTMALNGVHEEEESVKHMCKKSENEEKIQESSEWRDYGEHGQNDDKEREMMNHNGNSDAWKEDRSEHLGDITSEGSERMSDASQSSFDYKEDFGFDEEVGETSEVFQSCEFKANQLIEEPIEHEAALTENTYSHHFDDFPENVGSNDEDAADIDRNDSILANNMSAGFKDSEQRQEEDNVFDFETSKIFKGDGEARGVYEEEKISGTGEVKEKTANKSVQKQIKDDETSKREREREKNRIVVERAIREARERAFAEARERAERAAVEKATAEARERVMAEARQKFEKTNCATKSSTERVSIAKLRSERAAVERAHAEARERALEKALSQKSNSNIPSSKLEANNGETAERRNARLERTQRTMERAAKALAEKNMRDLRAQREQAERHRLAETLDAEIKRWSSGKTGNLRALLSTLQYILGPDSGWQPVSLTEIVTTSAVKKAYRKATLHVHPDKLQQRGASMQQKYICEKVFDLLKAAWNKFNSEER